MHPFIQIFWREGILLLQDFLFNLLITLCCIDPIKVMWSGFCDTVALG